MTTTLYPHTGKGLATLIHLKLLAGSAVEIEGGSGSPAGLRGLQSRGSRAAGRGGSSRGQHHRTG